MAKLPTVNREDGGSTPPPGATRFPVPGGYAYAWVEGPGFINIIVDDNALAHAANSLNGHPDA